MAKFTSNADEIERFTRVSKEIPFSGIVRLVLRDGTEIEGAIQSHTQGNNGVFNKTQYSGAVQLKTLAGETTVVDYLDIATTASAWSNHRAYVDRGIISVIE